MDVTLTCCYVNMNVPIRLDTRNISTPKSLTGKTLKHQTVKIANINSLKLLNAICTLKPEMAVIGNKDLN